jgi:hypothetical protein
VPLVVELDRRNAFRYCWGLSQQYRKGQLNTGSALLQADGRDIVEALVFLAAYCKNQGLLHEAEQYCTKLMDYGGPVSRSSCTG